MVALVVILVITSTLVVRMYICNTHSMNVEIYQIENNGDCIHGVDREHQERSGLSANAEKNNFIPVLRMSHHYCSVLVLFSSQIQDLRQGLRNFYLESL